MGYCGLFWIFRYFLALTLSYSSVSTKSNWARSRPSSTGQGVRDRFWRFLTIRKMLSLWSIIYDAARVMVKEIQTGLSATTKSAQRIMTPFMPTLRASTCSNVISRTRWNLNMTTPCSRSLAFTQLKFSKTKTWRTSPSWVSRPWEIWLITSSSSLWTKSSWMLSPKGTSKSWSATSCLQRKTYSRSSTRTSIRRASLWAEWA